MECREIRKLLSPFVDNELGAHDAFAVAEHLEACVPCQREMQHLRRLDERLKVAGLASVEGVDGVRTDILTMLSPWVWVRRWRGVGVAVAALLFLVVGRQLFSAPNPAAPLKFVSPEERLTVEQPVNAYTRGAAYARFSDDYLGTLEAGKEADLAVLTQDIFSVRLEEIGNTQAVLTMVGGKIVFDDLR